MRRENKYPDTTTFHFYNANPHNRLTSDCVVRALSTALGMDYNKVVMELAEIHCKTGFESTDKKTIDKFLSKHGWIKCKQPRKADGTKYTGKEFCMAKSKTYHPNDIPEVYEPVIAKIGGHHVVAIVDNKVYDTWNSTDGCIGNYWVKGN